MIAAPVHIGFASWRAPAPKPGHPYDKAIRWVIVVDDAETGASKVTVSQATSLHPINQIIDELCRIADSAGGAVWVNVPAKRLGVAKHLHDLGVPVTLGIADQNRAIQPAIDVITRQTALANKFEAVYRKYSTPRNLPSRREIATRLRDAGIEAHTTYNPIKRIVFWWPSETRHTTARHDSPLIIATDASSDNVASGAACSAAVSLDGDMAIKAAEAEPCIGNSEARAIILALGIIVDARPTRAVILSDSRDAIEAAIRLVNGSAPEPGFHGISHELQQEMAEYLEQIPCPVNFQWVKGHSGHPLNEAADELAALGRLASHHPKKDCQQELYDRIDRVVDKVQHLNSADILPGEPHREEICKCG
jgi:ribonuclease HI